jgi:glycosyltransferase involved in cell wall biosynthesis
MVTVALELTRRLLRTSAADGLDLTLLCSRSLPEGLDVGPAAVLLSPWRHEVVNKLRWLPVVETQAELDHILYPFWPSPPLRRRRAPPTTFYVHDLAFKVRPAEVPWQQRAYLGRVLAPALRGAVSVVTPSEATRRDLLASFPMPGLEARVHLVPEGRSLDGVEPAADLPDGLAPGFLLAVGTIEPRKNYPRLLQAYRRLKQRGVTADLVVVGRTGWAYGSALDDLRAEPNVRLLGHVSDGTLRRLYQSAAVLAFPSLYEGFGLPLLEAMAEGLPAVVGDAGALPELAGGAALLVDPNDTESIADGLERVLTDTELQQRLSRLGRERAAGFAWESAAEQLLSLMRASA